MCVCVCVTLCVCVVCVYMCGGREDIQTYICRSNTSGCWDDPGRFSFPLYVCMCVCVSACVCGGRTCKHTFVAGTVAVGMIRASSLFLFFLFTCCVCECGCVCVCVWREDMQTHLCSRYSGGWDDPDKLSFSLELLSLPKRLPT